MRYRIMVEGEDHMVFCFENNIEEDVIAVHFDNAVEEFPCAKVFIEDETESQRAT